MVPHHQIGEIPLPLRKVVAAFDGMYEYIEVYGEDRVLAVINMEMLLIFVGTRYISTAPIIRLPNGYYTFGESLNVILESEVERIDGEVFFLLRYFSAAFDVSFEATGNVIELALR